MFQPFLPLTKQYIDGLIRLKKTFLVSQSYERGMNHFDNKTPVLFTDYDGLGEAQIHKSAMGMDKLAAIVDLKDPGHLGKIYSMVKPDADFMPYWSIVKNKEETQKMLLKSYMDNVRRYIDKSTHWSISRGEGVTVAMQIVYGIIFVDLRYRNQQIRVKFEVIESA